MVCSRVIDEEAIFHNIYIYTEWVKVPIVETLQRVICGATNRVFVGVPLCP